MAKEQHWRKIGIGNTSLQGDLEGIRWWLKESKKAYIGDEDLLFDKKIRNTFIIACEFGHLDIVKLIYGKRGSCMEEISSNIYVHDCVVDYLLETNQWQPCSGEWVGYLMHKRYFGRIMKREHNLFK